MDSEDDLVFKATDTTTGQIVGLSHWFVGKIELPKYDPFAKDKDTVDDRSAMGIIAKPVSEGDPFDFYDVFQRPIQNAWIYFIRGKRHVRQFHPWTAFALRSDYDPDLRRVAVLPEYQRRGIASRLLQWGVDKADEDKLVSWLNARPAGQRLYEKVGWEVVRVIPFDIRGFKVAPNVSMLRLPQPRSNTR